MEGRPPRPVKAKHCKTYYFYKMQRSEDPADNVFKEEQTAATPPRGAAIGRCPKRPSRPSSAAEKFVERRPLDVEPTALKKCYGQLSGKHRLRHLVPVLGLWTDTTWWDAERATRIQDGLERT